MRMTVPLMTPPDAMPARLVTIAPNQGEVILLLIHSVNLKSISPRVVKTINIINFLSKSDEQFIVQ
jgi:hypothetical protein